MCQNANRETDRGKRCYKLIPPFTKQKSVDQPAILQAKETDNMIYCNLKVNFAKASEMHNSNIVRELRQLKNEVYMRGFNNSYTAFISI